MALAMKAKRRKPFQDSDGTGRDEGGGRRADLPPPAAIPDEPVLALYRRLVRAKQQALEEACDRFLRHGQRDE